MKLRHNLATITATVAAATICTTALTHAGDALTANSQTTDAPTQSWRDFQKTMGTLYKNKDNPYLQELKVFSRYHYQAGYIAGSDINGESYDSKSETNRRARVGLKLKFAKYFNARLETQMVRDTRYARTGKNTWGQPQTWRAFDQFWVRFNADQAFDLDIVDKLSLTYGRQKFLMGPEVHESSKKIKTIERSALANTLYLGALPAGYTLSATKDSWKVNASIYSDILADSKKNSVLGDWTGGEGYLINAIKTLENEDQVFIDLFYHNDENGGGKNDFFFNKKWALSLAYQGELDRWSYMSNIMVADRGDQPKDSQSGVFYGIINQATYWLAQDTVEWVGQYQWQGSVNGEGVRANSRLFASGTDSDNTGGGDTNGGRGDSHHQLYTGVNLYINDDRMKVMLGVQYDNVRTPDGYANGTTLWAAFRTYF